MVSRYFDYFTQPELPSPTIGDAEAQALIAEHFGIAVEVQSLGSQQDQNFLLLEDGAQRRPVGVLKLSNPAFSDEEIEMQDLAAATVAAANPGIRIPVVVEGPRGRMAASWRTSQGTLNARVLSHIAGRTLMGSGYLSPAVVSRMGELAGATSVALRAAAHPASTRVLQWDLRHATRVVETLLPSETDARIRDLVRTAAAEAAAAMSSVQDKLPVQVGHFDITDDNIIAPPGSALPDAIIDFGDVSSSWAVGEIAVTASSVLHHDDAHPLSALPAIRAFHARRPLSSDEVEALWPLVVLRGAVLVLSGRQQVAVDDDNAYARAALDRELRILEVAASVPLPVMTAALREALGFPTARPTWDAGAVLPARDRTFFLDAGTSADVNDEGAWVDASALDAQAEAVLAAGAPAVYLPAGEPRLTGAPSRTPQAPATVPTSATLWLAERAELLVPNGASATVEDGRLSLSVEGSTLTFSGPGVGGTTLPAGSPIRVQLRADETAAVPDAVPTAYASGWRAVLGDPATALGFDTVPDARADLLDRRESVLAEVQEHYYAAPPQIERGWREYLIDTDGRVYLDMVNNIISVGHAHPGVVAAAHRQMRRLNTNSRFNYRSIVEYAERISATLPDELDTVFLVNSGSEATDLAIRLAMASTGRRDMVAMQESYHGWTFASDAVSTSIADNPNALDSRPEWVHTVSAANSYRGIHRAGDAHRYAQDAVATIDRLARTGRPPAGFISESYFGNAGGVAYPDGYLAAVYGAIRAHGGVAIADEVQVGFGRLGAWFWGFQQQGVVPDIVAVAKSVGNGQPIGAVVTTREIAERYRTQGYFFSSTGGSPVSSAIGMAVLDAIQNERLQENALDVGTHLKRRLEELGTRHPIVGAVHGSGLYLGLEFVRDHTTLEPATEETMAICNRLLERGVIMQPTGDHLNVLKIKPPLCVSRESVDYFADQLEHVLATGW